MSEMQKSLLGQAAPKEEEWRSVVRCPTYEVSNLGRVRRVTILKAQPDSNGYALVSLWSHNQCLKQKVHILVAAAGFIGPKPSLDHEVNHRDFDRMNPDADNLEWNTRLENVRHSFKFGNRLQTKARGEDCGNAKLKNEQARCIRLFRGTGWRQRSMAKHFGVSQRTIMLIQLRRTWATV